MQGMRARSFGGWINTRTYASADSNSIEDWAVTPLLSTFPLGIYSFRSMLTVYTFIISIFIVVFYGNFIRILVKYIIIETTI